MKSEDDPEARIRELEQPLADTARASEIGVNPPPGKWAAPPGPAFPPATPPPSYGSPSPWAPPRSKSRNQVWWVLSAFFIIGTIAVPLGLAVFGVNRATHGRMVILSPTTNTPSISPSAAAPTVSEAQTPTPAPPTAPAGANLTISGIKESRTIACNQGAVNVSGISNKVVITGHCTSLHLSGVQNSVVVDAVDSIEVSGFNNQITYHSGSPSIDNAGEQNIVKQG